jgi:arylsulfatase A-like enzyme
MFVSRRHFLFGSLALPALAGKKPAPERPNIALLLVDNLPAYLVGCYGNKDVKTPNIDRLSQTGTRFLNHFTAAPGTAGGRASLLTGRTPMQLGAAGAASASDVPVDRMLAGVGYASQTVDSVDAAVKYIQGQAAAKPFVLTVNFTQLTPPYNGVPQKFLDLYTAERFENYAAEPVAANARAGKEMLLNRLGNLRKVAGTISAIDDGVGTIVTTLYKQQLLDNTVVLFAATCGSLYGRHGLWDAAEASDPVNMFDEVTNTPIIWSWPHRIPPQGLQIEMVSSCDLLPTLCDLLTVNQPDRNLCGRSYLPLVQGKKLPKKQPWRFSVWSHAGNADMAREERYKVVIRDGGKGPGELYDFSTDAPERSNQFDNPQYVDVKTRLEADINKWKQNFSS